MEPRSESHPVKRRGRRFLIALGALALLVALIAVIPRVISETSLRNSVLLALVGHGDTKVTSNAASLGWFSPLVIEGFQLETLDGQVDIEIERVQAERSWLSMWWSRPDLGRIDFKSPKIRVVADSTTSDSDQSVGQWPILSAAIQDGTLVVQDESSRESTVDIQNLDIDLKLWRGSAGSMLTVEPIQLVQRDKLTPDICDSGMQLVVPELAEELRLEGEYSLQIVRVELPLETEDVDSTASVEGILRLHQVTAGLKNDVTRRFVQMAAEMLELGEVPEEIRLTEDVELAFRYDNGRVSHDGMAVFVPKLVPGLSIRSTGSVGLDESLDLQMSLLVPISIASDTPLAKQLSDVPLEINVSGTIDTPQPSVAPDQQWVSLVKQRQSSADASAEEKELAESLMNILEEHLGGS